MTARQAIWLQPFLREFYADLFSSEILASIVLSRGMNQMASRDLLHVAVPLHISASGLAILTSGLFVLLAAVWLSLRRTLRISVRDALAYE